MQTFTWYARRLKAMSPRELAWHLRSHLRDVLDRRLMARRGRPRAVVDLLRDAAEEETPGFRLTEVPVGAWAAAGAGSLERAWLERLRARADGIAAGRIPIFDLERCDLGRPIDWNRDPKWSIKTPMDFAASIDYRDFAVTGDAKLVWEASRHQHLVVLARAYRASGDLAYAEALLAQLESWLEQCPYGVGMQWRSPLEVALRLVSWAFALDLVRESGLVEGPGRRRILNAVRLHLLEIARKYSRGSSANNHLVGEALGVFVGASYWQDLREAPALRAEAQAILARTLLEQTFEDGASREQATGYHLFALEMFLVAGSVARRTGRDFPRAWWDRLEAMVEFGAALAAGGRELPMLGDCDDAYVVDLGARGRDYRALLSAAAAVVGRPDLAALAGGDPEPAWWWAGPARLAREPAAPGARLESRAFEASGHYLLQAGRAGAPERLSVLFDCGELGLGPLAAHGHADALSITLRAFGEDVLVDPGTYDYYSFPAWRDHFRSTRAHNTVVVDGADQSNMLGPFLWGERAAATCLLFEARVAGGGRVVGEHDGYARLEDPVLHRRALDLDARARVLAISDEVVARGRHDVAILFHLGERCRVAAREGGRIHVDVAGLGRVTLELDPRLAVDLVSGSEAPIGGWVSRGYHRRAPSTTIVARAATEGAATFVTRVTVGAPAGAAHGAADRTAAAASAPSAFVVSAAADGSTEPSGGAS